MSDRQHRFGRLPRKRSPAVPHMASLMAGRRSALAPVPATAGRYQRLGALDLGALGNLTAGDCTSAGEGHIIQVTKFLAAGVVPTGVTEAAALQNYRETSGWDGVAGDATDTGCIEQDALSHWVRTGFPLSDGSRDLLHSFFEADPASYGQISRGIYEAGAVYGGIIVPRWLAGPGEPPPVWDLHGGELDAATGDGHCITFYDFIAEDNVPMIYLNSWGKWYWATMRWLETVLDEAYPIVSPDFVMSTGVTPLNLSLSDLDEQMAAIRAMG